MRALVPSSLAQPASGQSRRSGRGTALKRPEARAWCSAVDPGERPGLDDEGLEVVVEVEGLDSLADGPGVAGHHAWRRRGPRRSRPQGARRCACRHSARAPSRSTGARRPGSWCRPGAGAVSPTSKGSAGSGRRWGCSRAKCSATVIRRASMRRMSSRRSPSATSSFSSAREETLGMGTMWRRRNRPISPSTPPFSWAPSLPGRQ